MLSEFFGESARKYALHEGPSGPLLEDFAGYLFRSGYSKISARRHIRSAEHMVHWALRNGLSVGGLDGPALARFDRHLCRCRCGRFYCAARVDIVNGARLFLTNLHGAEGAAIRLAKAVAPEPELLRSFCQWMRDQRGSADGTLSNYGRPIRELIRLIGEDPSKLTARFLRQFVMERSQQVGWAAANHCTTGLRMFLRFLIADDRCSAGLLGAIPKLAHWRLSSLPRVLAPADVERIIASCDPSAPDNPAGRRPFLGQAFVGLLGRLDDSGHRSRRCFLVARGQRLDEIAPHREQVRHQVRAHFVDQAAQRIGQTAHDDHREAVASRLRRQRMELEVALDAFVVVPKIRHPKGT